MLPSTGYFNGINCPFYENGPCDRPYCHFRHAKKDLQNIANDSIESGAILQKLVSAAVQKVLQQKEVTATVTSTQIADIDIADTNKSSAAPTIAKATYNPTPIAELNKINNTDTENNDDINEQRKRHIPVPYTPRKPTSAPIKRTVDTNGSTKPFVYNPPPLKYTPGSAEIVLNDKYTPTGAVESKETYLPGSEKELQEYTIEPLPHDTTKRNYVPSNEKNVSKKKILEYKPAKVSTKAKPSVTYQPTPRSLAPCFSSDEDEPDTKKRKLSNDLNGLDDLGPEFDILDQILDEEKTLEEPKIKVKKNVLQDKEKATEETKVERNKEMDKEKSVKETKIRVKKSDETKPHSITDSKENNSDTSKTDKETSQTLDKEKSIKETKIKVKKSDENKPHSTGTDSKEKNGDASKSEKEKSHKSHHKSKSDRRDKSSSKDKEKKEIKENSDKKSSHKSSSKEKERKDKDSKSKHSSDKKKHSSKSTSESHTHSSSKKSEKETDTKHSRSKSKNKEKRSKEKSHKSSKHDKDKHKSKKLSTIDLSDNDNNLNIEENGHDDEDDYDLSDADEETIALECKKIFEEYVPIVKLKSPDDEQKIVDTVEEEYIPTKKRVSRTADKNIKVINKLPIKPNFKVGAAKAMAERLAKVREFHSSRQPPVPNPPVNNENTNSKIDLLKNTYSPASTSTSKIRIAHVPYASTMVNARKTLPPPQSKAEDLPSTSSTICQTVKKGIQRVAHIPNEKFIDRPGVLEPLASKIAANIRSIYLNMMIDECLKLYINATDAYARAQHEELTTSKKCSTVQIYKNSAVLTVSRLRKELQECNGVKKSASNCSVLGKESSSSKSGGGSWSIESKNKKVVDNSKEFIGAKFYENISKWVLTEEQLQSNGFPRPHNSGDKGRAIIYGQNKKTPPKGYIRSCCRCKKDYTVDKRGFASIKEECIYHPNRIYRVRGEAKYQCCSQDGTSDGCCIAPSHVYEYVDFENLKGYVRTLPPETVMDDYGVYSLDCEMCYTTQGLDLTRVTVINSTCKVVYETLIKPLHPIVDYNTRYSGITEEQMSNVRTTLLEVQATLLTMFNRKTILVGHSLESDFKALKLIHDTVVDTSVLFPHKMGPPYKRALRNLSSEHLKKIIQNSVDGHDSAEDAMVCMELLHYKLKEFLKTR